MGKPNYGYFYLNLYLLTLGLFLIGGVAVYSTGIKLGLKSMIYGGVGLAAYGVLTTVGWALARYVIPGNRIKVARQVVNTLDLSGSEAVIDLGAGRGLYAIEVAKKMKSGRVIAVDVWDREQVSELTYHHHLSQPSGNSITNARKNAQIEGVSDKIEFLNMDVNNLKFSTNVFDVVVCAYLLGHLGRYEENSLKEIYRVLKPGGTFLLVDNVRDFTYFLLSTPHFFLISYLRGTKARRLTKRNWVKKLVSAGFQIGSFETKRGVLTVKARK